MVDCTHVYVKESSFSQPDNVFLGVFSKKNFKEGDIVETGIMRRLSDNDNKCFDGMKNPYVFTWSDDIPNHTWAFASGCATFYNTSKKANTYMERYFDTDTFKIIALTDIDKDTELTHTYKSLRWRTVFKDLNDSL